MKYKFELGDDVVLIESRDRRSIEGILLKEVIFLLLIVKEIEMKYMKLLSQEVMMKAS